jgi:hypothetical protein
MGSHLEPDRLATLISRTRCLVLVDRFRMTISMARTGLAAGAKQARLCRAYVPREQAAHVRAAIDE